MTFRVLIIRLALLSIKISLAQSDSLSTKSDIIAKTIISYSNTCNWIFICIILTLYVALESFYFCTKNRDGHMLLNVIIVPMTYFVFILFPKHDFRKCVIVLATTKVSAKILSHLPMCCKSSRDIKFGTQQGLKQLCRGRLSIVMKNSKAMKTSM